MIFSVNSPNSRFLVAALLVSLLAHLVALSLFWPPLQNKVSAASGSVVEARLQAPNLRAELPGKKASGAVSPELHPQINVRSRMLEPVTTVTVAPAAVPLTARAAGGPSSDASAVPTAVSATPGNPNEVFGYRAALGGAIARLRARYEERYGDSERESRHGRSGRAEFVLRALNGAPPALSLSKTSGHRILDDQAQALFYQAIQVTALPSALRGKSFAIPLVMEFQMDGADQ